MQRAHESGDGEASHGEGDEDEREAEPVEAGGIRECFGDEGEGRVRRDVVACIDCGKCTKACPTNLPVDRLIQIHSLECTSCMECVAVCPAENALQLSLSSRRQHPIDSTGTAMGAPWQYRAVWPEAIAAILALLFFGLIGVARATGHWQTKIAQDVYSRMVPRADEYEH